MFPYVSPRKDDRHSQEGLGRCPMLLEQVQELSPSTSTRKPAAISKDKPLSTIWGSLSGHHQFLVFIEENIFCRNVSASPQINNQEN